MSEWASNGLLILTSIRQKPFSIQRNYSINQSIYLSTVGKDVQVQSYGWQFLDANGVPQPFGELAKSVEYSTAEGTLILDEPLALDTDAKGRCVVIAQTTVLEESPDGGSKERKEEVLFGSKWFGISITDDGASKETPGGPDGKRLLPPFPLKCGVSE